MFDGSVPWSLGVGGGERSWRALGAPKRLWRDGFVVIDGVFVVAVGVSAEEGAWNFFARGAWFVVLWLTLAWTVSLRRV